MPIVPFAPAAIRSTTAQSTAGGMADSRPKSGVWPQPGFNTQCCLGDLPWWHSIPSVCSAVVCVSLCIGHSGGHLLNAPQRVPQSEATGEVSRASIRMDALTRTIQSEIVRLACFCANSQLGFRRYPNSCLRENVSPIPRRVRVALISGASTPFALNRR